MEGTRLTIVKVPTQPDAFEFSIRTPVTPPRWRDFDQVTMFKGIMLLTSYPSTHAHRVNVMVSHGTGSVTR